MRFEQTGWGYECILDGPRFRNGQEAENAAAREFATYFSDADPSFGVRAEDDDGKGSWSLRATRLIRNGELITHIMFENYRPAKRIVGPLRMEMSAT